MNWKMNDFSNQVSTIFQTSSIRINKSPISTVEKSLSSEKGAVEPASQTDVKIQTEAKRKSATHSDLSGEIKDKADTRKVPRDI